jgi:hypothetical protein
MYHTPTPQKQVRAHLPLSHPTPMSISITPLTQMRPRSPKRTAAIVGGTLGALSILLFLLLAFLYQTRNRVRKATAKAGTRLGGDGVRKSDGDGESDSVSMSDVETLVDGGQEKGSG